MESGEEAEGLKKFDKGAALALAEHECESKGPIIDDLRHDLAAIDGVSWATVRSLAYLQTMAARAQLVMQLAELEAKA